MNKIAHSTARKRFFHTLCFGKEAIMSYIETKQHGTIDFPIQLYSIDDKNPKYEMAHHWHESVEIIRIISGRLNMKLNNRFFCAGEGELIFVNPETVHGASPENCKYECIVFSTEILSSGGKEERAFIENIENHVFAVNDHFDKNSIVKPAADSLFEAMKEEKGSFFIIAQLYSLFAVIMENKLYKKVSELGGSEKTNAKLRRVLSFIRQSYDKQISLEEMAFEADMSPKYFCAFFREMTGKTPVKYLNTYRVERAARKLISTDMPITDIAYGCGFNDLSYFIKTFKSIKGITPKAFRADSAY